VLPTPSRTELRRRVPRLVWGLVLFGLGLAMTVASDLGLAPWQVLHQGIARHIPLGIGTVGIGTGLLVLLLWIPLGERIGVGTAVNVVLVGVVIDVTLLWLDVPSSIAARWALLLGGLVLIGVASGYYIGAGLGPGPRDGLMTGLGRRGWPIGRVRTGIEVSVLVGGWALGGTVGVGTVLFSLGIGPLVQFFLPRLSLPPATP
jgi:uncharacterized membrane protein YczE